MIFIFLKTVYFPALFLWDSNISRWFSTQNWTIFTRILHFFLPENLPVFSSLIFSILLFIFRVFWSRLMAPTKWSYARSQDMSREYFSSCRLSIYLSLSKYICLLFVNWTVVLKKGDPIFLKIYSHFRIIFYLLEKARNFGPFWEN